MYAIHIGKTTLPNDTFDWHKVHYIGMTTRTLQQRLYQFNRAIQGKRGHSGGNTIFAEKGLIDTKYIYVAMMGIKHKNLPYSSLQRTLGKVVCLEYEAFAQFYDATNQPRPIFNKQ